MEPRDRLCLWCTHIRQELGTALSEDTWESGELSCAMGHWSIRGDALIADTNVGELYAILRKAVTCADFALHPHLVNIGLCRV